MKIQFNDVSRKAVIGDVVELQGQEQEVVVCQETGVLMLNIDAGELKAGDLRFIKGLGLTISNPNTAKPVALGVDFEEDTWGQRINKYLKDDVNEDDDDSDFFGSVGGAFLGGLGSSGFGSFGGFGGGSFGGGGASRGF